MRGEFIDVNGARLYYYAAGTRGAGEPVVFLHAFPTSSHLWTEVVPLVPKGHRVVVVDLLGYGRSDRPAGRDVSVRGHAERVVGLLDALSINYACIVGHEHPQRMFDPGERKARMAEGRSPCSTPGRG